MKLLVTGGAGFIGSHISEQALADGHQVIVIDNLSTGHRKNVPADAEFHEVDLRDRDAVIRVISDSRPDVISHQAAQASVAISVREPVLDATVNIIGSLNVLDAAVEHGVDRVIFASTGGAIYGEIAEGRATTATPPRPMSPYAAAKFSVENYLRCYQHEHGLKSTVLRYANVYGPRQDPHGEAGVVAIFCQRLLAGESICINARSEDGDDGCVRDYVYIDDVARANIAAMNGDVRQDVVNVCTGIPTQTHDLAKELIKALDSSSEVTFAPLRPGDVERSVLDPTEISEILGGVTDLKKGVVATAAWFAAKR